MKNNTTFIFKTHSTYLEINKATSNQIQGKVRYTVLSQYKVS